MDRYQLIQQLISNNLSRVNFAPFGEGTSDEWIVKAQKRLNVIFPPSYIWWLKNYGGGEILGDEIFSVYERDEVVGGDVVYMNELDRKNKRAMDSELMIQNTDFGEIYFLDLTQVDEHGESPVYNKTTGKKYADDFLDFLKKKIEGK